MVGVHAAQNEQQGRAGARRINITKRRGHGNGPGPAGGWTDRADRGGQMRPPLADANRA